MLKVSLLSRQMFRVAWNSIVTAHGSTALPLWSLHTIDPTNLAVEKLLVTLFRDAMFLNI